MNVFLGFLEIIFSSYDMLKIVPLPNRAARTSKNPVHLNTRQRFESPNDFPETNSRDVFNVCMAAPGRAHLLAAVTRLFCRDAACCARFFRSKWLCNCQDSMQMIWHHYEFVQNNRREPIRQTEPGDFHRFACRSQNYLSGQHTSKGRFPFVRADRDEVRCRL